MQTYFIRHTVKLDIDDATRRALWEQRRIATHFPDAAVGKEWPARDSTSLDPNDYPRNGRLALGRLLALAASGGYVYAEYFPRREALIGIVEPNSKIELWKGVWGTRNNRAGQVAVLKSIQLKRTIVIEPGRSVVLSAARPRQGTIMRWPSARQLVADLVEARKGKGSLEDLGPEQQEVMCSEFLRTSGVSALGLPVLGRLLLPVGRTLRDVDIAGLASDGSRILAQVTHLNSAKCGSKRLALRAYKGKRNHLLFFCDCDCVSTRDGMTEVPLSLVYESFRKDELGRKWLRAATSGGH